jgi:DNA-binding transcriptional LysR family regulator
MRTIDKINISDVKIFVEVATSGGFRAAANRLKRSPASITESIARLEDNLAIRLFERSTRSVELTSLGKAFFDSTRLVIKELDEAVVNIESQKDLVLGTIKISAPYSAGPFFLDALVSEFLTEFPDINVQVVYDDNKVDLLKSDVDIAVRSNTLLAMDTHALPVGPELEMSLVASEDYLSQSGPLKTPSDMVHHDALCFCFGRSGNIAPWTFIGEKDTFSMQPKPRATANDMRSLIHYAQQGLGIAYVYAEIAKPFIENGSLISLLSDKLIKLPRYSINYTSKKHMSTALRAFIDLSKNYNKPKAELASTIHQPED